MTRLPAALTALILLLVTLPSVAQTNLGGCAHPLHIEVGLPDGLGGTSWSCQNPSPIMEGKIRIHGTEGQWVQLMSRVYLRNVNPGDPAMVALETTLLGDFPWLAQPIPWDLFMVLGPPAGGLPQVHIDPLTFWENVFLPLLSLDPNEIKKFYQPIVLGMNSTRTWQANCPVWTSNPIIPGPPLDMSVLWNELLVDVQGSPDEFDFFSIMQFAAMVQGGANAISFLNSPGKLEDALQVGLHVELQAILLRSGDPAVNITSDEVTTDGLTGLDILVLPGLEVSAPLEITLTQGIPASGLPGGPIVAALPTHHLQTGVWNLIPLRRLVTPTGIRLHMPNLANFVLPVSYFSPGKAKVFIPAGLNLGVGYVDLINPFGTRLGGLNAPWSWINLTDQPLNVLSPGYTAP